MVTSGGREIVGNRFLIGKHSRGNFSQRRVKNNVRKKLFHPFPDEILNSRLDDIDEQ